MKCAILAALLCLGVTRMVASQGAGNRALTVGVIATAVPSAAGVVLLSGDGGTAPGLALLATGTILGPFIGNWVGGLTGRGFGGAGLRAAAVAGTFLGYALVCWDDCTDSERTTAGVITAGSAAVLAGLIVWDLATLKKAVRRHEAERVSLMPLYSPATRSAMVGVRVTF